MRQILPPGHYAFSVLMTDRAMLALGQGNITRAMDLSKQAVALGEAAIAKSKAGSFTFSTVLLNDSRIALAAGKPEQALSDADRLLAMEQSSDQEGALSAKAGNAYLARARALQAMGRHNDARAAAQVAVERLERSVGPDNPESQSARQLADLSSANR
jgi:tetratricopeptide (TPR) repeat protein